MGLSYLTLAQAWHLRCSKEQFIWVHEQKFGCMNKACSTSHMSHFLLPGPLRQRSHIKQGQLTAQRSHFHISSVVVNPLQCWRQTHMSPGSFALSSARCPHSAYYWHKVTLHTLPLHHGPLPVTSRPGSTPEMGKGASDPRSFPCWLLPDCSYLKFSASCLLCVGFAYAGMQPGNQKVSTSFPLFLVKCWEILSWINMVRILYTHNK